MKKTIALLLAFTLVLTLIPAFSACGGEGASTASASQGSNGAGGEIQASSLTYSEISVEYDSDDEDSSWNSAEASYVTLAGDSITLNGNGGTVDGTTLTITSGGTYVISGALDDGQLVVDSADEATVRLVLNGADISCSNSAPIYIVNAEKVVISLADGTENYVTDGDSYILEDTESDEPSAAIFSKDDLTINGNGSLTVEANYNNGIQSKDELKIVSGHITVTAVNDGIKGRDCIAIEDGNITVTAGGDGLQSNNDEDTENGFVFIEGGSLNITAGEDGIQAETSLIISGGNITIASGGGSANGSGNAGIGGDMWGGRSMDMGNWENWDTGADFADTGADISTKGLKAGVYLEITGGTFDIDSADDALHSNDSLTISGGDFSLASGDDGIHSDSALIINGGDINITQCYEGIESAVITINDGNIHLVASDDGINVVGGDDGSFMGGRPVQEDFEALSNNYLYINGGYIVIDATGDGLDINGSVNMTGGVVIINGPTNSANGAVDYYNTFSVSGGFLVAVGSSGMAQAPDTSSTQYSVLLAFDSSQSAGTMIHVETEDGQEILSFVPTKAYQSLLLCSAELEKGVSYNVYLGGSSTGTVADGLYSGGTYSGGTLTTSFTISSTVTNVGSAGGFTGGSGGAGGGFPDGGGGDMPGGGGGGMPGGGDMPPGGGRR